MRTVIALGGNAMTSPDGTASPQDQHAAVARAVIPIARLVADGHDVVITHGNGPQVGNILVKNQLAAAVVPPVPLSWCGAQTQATIGMLLMNYLDAELARLGADRRTATVVSRTLVRADDPGFAEPTKPIGRYLTKEETEPLVAHGERFTEVPGRGWRRVVASPEPVDVLDAPAAEALLGLGYVVVCSGGGGIPTVRRPDGVHEGIEAVIDKDLTAALLAERLGADALLIATDVDHVVLGWGTDDARPLEEVAVDELRRLADGGAFPAGSMGPKVEGALRFAERTGHTSVITSLDRLGDALAGRAGTRVVPGPNATRSP